MGLGLHYIACRAHIYSEIPLKLKDRWDTKTICGFEVFTLNPKAPRPQGRIGRAELWLEMPQSIISWRTQLVEKVRGT